MSSLRRATLSSTLLAALACVGCSAIESPYGTEPTFQKGEKGSYNITSITEADSPRCGTADECKLLGKLVLTKPNDNVSFQLARKDGGDIHYVTCASPAEAAKTVSTSGSVGVTASMQVAGTAAPASIAASQAMTQAEVLLASLDAASHFVATASFANCLAYASGMYDADSAKQLQGKIFDGAVAIAVGASAPSK